MSQTSLPPGPAATVAASLDAGEALAALAWLVEAGIDTLVESQPVRWLDAAPLPVALRPASAATTAAQSSTAPAPFAPTAAPQAARPVLVDTAALTAQAGGADTLAALQTLMSAAAGRPILFADGNPAARVMVLGDMPAADDIAAGRLFAGSAGQLLDRMLAAIGRDRADTYLANLLAAPLPGGRAPQPHEIAAALPFVRRQIEIIRPQALLVLGGVAAAALLGVETGINRLRGHWQNLELGALVVPVLPSFAPGYLLAHPAHKALAWRDLLQFRAAIAAATATS